MHVLNLSQFWYLFGPGEIVVVLVDWAVVRPQREETVGLGEAGEEGTYVVRTLLPLAPDSEPKLKEPVAVVLSDSHVNPWSGVISLMDPGLPPEEAE